MRSTNTAQDGSAAGGGSAALGSIPGPPPAAATAAATDPSGQISYWAWSPPSAALEAPSVLTTFVPGTQPCGLPFGARTRNVRYSRAFPSVPSDTRQVTLLSAGALASAG